MAKCRSHHMMVTGLFIGTLGAYCIMALRFPMAYIWATYEDLLGEWTQFWFFVVASLISIRILFLRTRHRLTFALLALSCFYVAMEEISWGQRVIGFSSSEFFKKHNLQSETNLHNLLTGPFSTNLKAALAYGLAAALVGYGLLYPIMLRRRMRLARWMDAHGIAPPPLYLWPFFLAAGILELGPFSFNEAEVAEVLVAMAVTVMAVHYAFALKRDLPPHESSTWVKPAPMELASRVATTSLLVFSIAANTALGLYATPEGRKRIDNRINNGVEKFAGRYARFGDWDTAIALYRDVCERNPTGRSNLRKLANAYRQAGEDEAADRSLSQALELDLMKFRKDPGAASVRRSLVRSYRMMGDAESAAEHLDEALRIGLTRIEEHPDSANAAYSLGRTLELIGRDPEALEQFERAFELNPTSKKLKKAYLKAKHKR